jgi:hypothetical protein
MPLLWTVLRALARVIALLILLLPAAAGAVEVHLADDASVLGPTSPPPAGHLPVLFVHGHNVSSSNDSDFNYRKNWRQPLGDLPSFDQALSANSGLGIEPYYIRFTDQDRSIVEDALDIKAAVEMILQRHDPGFDPADTNSTTPVRIAIIAYSKGTLSARLYLKSLEGLVPEIPPPPQVGFRPISEFVAISPPNHGINTAGLGAFSSLAVQQLLNGYGATTCLPVFGAESRDFIEQLNGHDIHDTEALDATDVYPSEAPASRTAMDAPTAGALYVTLFADGNRDAVGGDTVPANNDCQGRRLAVNLAPTAVNIPLAVSGISHDPLLADDSPPAIHQNTVHTFEAMCLALYAAVHHGSPLGQTCQSANGLPIIPPPTPTRAAAMLALDFSGSMSAPACPNCATRADVLKDAVELFVQLWSAVSVPSDRMGVTYFRTDVDQFNLAGETLPLLSDGGDDIIMNVNGQMPGSSTAMGGGLQRAIEALDGLADTPIRRVILFTDGMQNVNPMVQSAGGQLTIANEPGRPNSNVSPASPPTVLGPSLGIAVDTIGVGAGEAFVGLLQDIAAATDGRSWPTTDPANDLRRFFVEELINALRGFSPQLAAYRRGRTREGGGETFAIEAGARRLVLKLSWQRGQKLDFTVIKDGIDVTAAGRFIDGAFYRIFAIDLPSKGPGGPISSSGAWRMAITGKPGISYEAAAIVDTEKIAYSGAFGARNPRVGDLLELVVEIGAAGRPIAGPVKVTATLFGPEVAIGNVIAERPSISGDNVRGMEPGATAAERGLLAVAQNPRQWTALKPARQRLVLAADGKGVFRASLRPQVPGIYQAVIEISGADSKIGPFARTLTATMLVRFGKANPKVSELLALRETGVAGGRRYVTLIVTPRDARGNRLGPGLSTAVRLELSKGRSVGGVHDLGDGRYLFLVALSARDDPVLTLTVADSALFAGKLSALARRGRR